MDDAKTSRLTPARRTLLDRLLDQVLDLESDQRQEALTAMARTHPRVHAHLARLVDASTEPTQYLETLFNRVGSAALEAVEPETPKLPAGTRIGDWRIVDAVGAGGMGQVYRAERADGSFEMTAAIKFIRTPNHAQLNDRLALERQLLARLDHPNIARIMDGGTLDDGQTYLVMEWVDGQDWSDCHDRLRTAQHGGLQHLIEVASAVQHAHQRRVVHGDIKPANIRIMDNDRVRLLDFGVARLLSNDGDAHDRKALALTPAYAAPEQLAGEPASTQSDIFSLGKLMTWLLTGTTEPDQRTVESAINRRPRTKAIKAIIQQATAADPGQRYGAVSELINDLQALIEQRPVSVQRNSTIQRLFLWARRHRLAAATASLAALSIVVGTAGLAWQERIVRAERDLARFEAERATLIREQLTLLFREAGEEIQQENVTARDLLAESVRVAEQLHADDPEVLAAVRAFLGELYIAMDDFAAADPLLTAFVNDADARGSPDLLRAVVLADLSQIRLRQGESEAALALVDESLSILADHPADNRARLGDILTIRGQALRGLGRWDEAINSAERGLAMAQQVVSAPSRLLATIENNLATTMIYSGRTMEALPHLRKALDNWRGLGLEDSSSALTVMTNLASLLHQQGNLEQAEQLYRESIERRRQRFGESGALGAAYLNLGTLLTQRYELELAGQHVQQGIELIERFEGEQTINQARGLLVRSRWRLAVGDFIDAHDDVSEALRLFDQTLGSDHLFSRVAQAQQAMIVAQAARDEFANLNQLTSAPVRNQIEDVIGNLENLKPQSNRFLAQALCELARYDLAERSPERALEAASQCLDLRLELTSERNWEVAEAQTIVAAAELVMGSQQAENELQQARSHLVQVLGDQHPKVQWCERWLDLTS